MAQSGCLPETEVRNSAIGGVASDRDFAVLLHEWRIPVAASKPNPNEMTDFNVLTMNGKVMPFTEPLVVKLGDTVWVRYGNLSAMDHHPIHLLVLFQVHSLWQLTYRLPC